VLIPKFEGSKASSRRLVANMKQAKDENEASEEDADEYGQENLTGISPATHQ
jgi:hypothetical protein